MKVRTQYETVPGRHVRRASLGVAAGLLAVTGCASPLDRSPEEALRERVIQARREVLATGPGADTTITVTREVSEVEAQLSGERRDELDAMSGRSAYEGQPLELGDDLSGVAFGKSETVELSLDRAIRLAVEHNLDAAVARLGPRVAFEDVARAEAVFDAVFFAEFDYQNLDTPQPPGVISGLSGDVASENVTLTAGLRQRLDLGTVLSVQTSPSYRFQSPTVNAFDDFYTASISATIQQPLLEGFGTDVNRAEVRLARNATLAERQALRATLLSVVSAVHGAYWDLFAAQSNLLIQQRLLGRTVDDRDRLVKRKDFDVSPVRITEANSFVELRRSDVIRARNQVRLASDALKSLLSAPDLPVAGETLVLPADEPTLEPITFNLIELVSRSIERRPELRQALLGISDARVRQAVAKNARLPELDAAFTLALNGLDDNNLGDAYGNDVFELEYIDYLLSLRFEQALGNRGDRAAFRQATLQRDRATRAYEREVRDVVLEVKSAMRDLITSYELIGASRAARRAAADSLRAIEAQEEAGVALTPEFLLDLKLATQQRLADAEVAEVQAIADYNTAIADLFFATGTLLDRHGVEVAEPDAWPSRLFWKR